MFPWQQVTRNALFIIQVLLSRVPIVEVRKQRVKQLYLLRVDFHVL